jgi:hypothetical protein
MIGIPTPTTSLSQITEVTCTFFTAAGEDDDETAAAGVVCVDAPVDDAPDESAGVDAEFDPVLGGNDPVVQALSAIATTAISPAAPRARVAITAAP